MFQQEVDENLNFDEIILEACKSIASATTALIATASSTQREFEETGLASEDTSNLGSESQWSEGLISAARFVAAAIQALCESANDLVQGKTTEHKLIAAAKQVAGSTAHLLVACQVKGNQRSKNVKGLQEAGHAVKRATDNLVKAAHNAIRHEEEIKEKHTKSMLDRMASEIEARQKILELEEKIQIKKREYDILLHELETPETASVMAKAKEVNLRKKIADLQEAKDQAEKDYKLMNESKYSRQSYVDVERVNLTSW